MKKYNENQIGKKYNRLTILKYVGKNKHGLRKVLCKCNCGNYTIQVIYSVLYGSVKSCGCYRKEKYRIHKLKLWPKYIKAKKSEKTDFLSYLHSHYNMV